MNKKLYLVFFLFVNISVFSQTAEQVGWVTKFGLAGGFTPIWLNPNLNSVKDLSAGLGMSDFSTSGIMTYGGGGYAYLMFIDNLRIGGLGFTGSRTKSSPGSELNYSIGGGGLTLEYTVPSIKRIAVSPGVILGFGSIEIMMSRNNSNYVWDNLFNDQDLQSSSKTIYNNYYFISPTFNVDIPFNRFFAFRIGAGYQFTFADNWKVDNDRKISGVPSDLNGNAFFIQVGIFAGFFAF